MPLFTADVRRAGDTMTGALQLPTGDSALKFSTDVLLQREAANVLSLRNGTSGQSFYAFRTYTDGSNYERGRFAWNSNVLEIGAEAAGSGTQRNVRFYGAEFGVGVAATSGVLFTVGATLIVRDSAGRVGINTGAVPACALDVVGLVNTDTGYAFATNTVFSVSGSYALFGSTAYQGVKCQGTWNDAGTIFSGLLLNITNTASSASSKLLELQLSATDKFSVDKNGAMVAVSTVTATGAILGTNPASAGTVRVPNASWIAARNAANSGDKNIAQVDSSDILRLGSTARTAATLAASFSATHYIRVRDDAGNDCYVPCMTATW